MSPSDNRAPAVRLHPVGGGKTIDLTSTGYDPYTLKQGIEGLGLPPVEHKMIESTGFHGSLVRSTHLKERDIFLPIVMMGESQDVVLGLWRDLLDVLRPRSSGTPRLEVQLPGEASRFIDVLYKDGLKGDFGDKYRKVHMTVGVTLIAANPLWYGEDKIISWSPKSDVGKHFISDTDNFLPVILTPSAVGELTEIIINSDQEVTPTWRITGPVTDVKVTHVETGAFFQVLDVFKPGEWMVLDVASYDVYDSLHTRGELWDRVTAASTLFRLPPGKNTIRVEATAMNHDSAIQLVYKPTYLRGI